MPITAQLPTIPKRVLFDGKFCLPAPTTLEGTFSTLPIFRATLTSLTQTGGVATATVSSNHNLLDGAIILISGATEYEYNGLVQVTVTGLTTFTFRVISSALTPATGTIVASQPGARAKGVGTKATKLTPGEWIYVASQNAVRMISLVHDDLNWEFEENFPSDVVNEPVKRTVQGLYQGLAFQNQGMSAATLAEETFASGAAESYVNNVALAPVCGDATDTIVLVQMAQNSSK